MDATDVEQVLLMVEDQLEVFNKVNASTAGAYTRPLFSST
jgi:hypothetical protein